VIIATHNLQKGERAAQEVTNATGASCFGYLLDLSSFASVHAFAKKFTNDFHGKLDLLFNNAGISGETGTDALTGDGFEEVFQVDYLGPFLLTELLLPALRKSGGRIVSTSSSGHKVACAWAGLPSDCLKGWTNIPPKPVSGHLPFYEGFIPKTNYGVAKTMQIMHAQELAARESVNGVTAFSICPGYVNTSMTAPGGASGLEIAVVTKISCLAFKVAGQAACPYSPEQGAAVLAYAGLRAEAKYSGEWYTRYTGCQPDKVATNGFSSDMRPELYAKSLEWVGLKQSGGNGNLVI